MLNRKIIMIDNIKLSKTYTVEELHNGAIENIPSASGVYFVLIPKGFDLVVKETTDGRKVTSKGRISSYPVKDLQRRLLHYGDENEKRNSQILYIGQSVNLHQRRRAGSPDFLSRGRNARFSGVFFLKHCFSPKYMI